MYHHFFSRYYYNAIYPGASFGSQTFLNRSLLLSTTVLNDIHIGYPIILFVYMHTIQLHRLVQHMWMNFRKPVIYTHNKHKISTDNLLSKNVTLVNKSDKHFIYYGYFEIAE